MVYSIPGFTRDMHRKLRCTSSIHHKCELHTQYYTYSDSKFCARGASSQSNVDETPTLKYVQDASTLVLLAKTMHRVHSHAEIRARCTHNLYKSNTCYDCCVMAHLLPTPNFTHLTWALTWAFVKTLSKRGVLIQVCPNLWNIWNDGVQGLSHRVIHLTTFFKKRKIHKVG